MNIRVPLTCREIASMLPESIKKYLRPSYQFYFEKRVGLKNKMDVNTILKYYNKKINPSEDIIACCNHIRENGLSTYPYPWYVPNESTNIVVNWDKKLELPYVMLENKRLYYPRTMPKEDIQRDYYLFQTTETENAQCPHKYLTDDFDISDDYVVIDGGGSCGNFSLSIVDKIKKIYLFEPDEKWLEPLNATFAPYGNKVKIIQKFISDENNQSCTTIDASCSDESGPFFIKLDVEGFERKALEGATVLIKSGKVEKISVCCYHYQNDKEDISNYLSKFPFKITPSTGFILVHLDELQPPFFRTALLRCEKM